MLEVDDWAEQVASELVDGRTVSIDEASDGSVTLVWHWLNMGISSIHVQSRPTQGDPSGVLCGGTPAVLLGEFISLFNEYLRRGAISLATGSPPMLSDMLP